MPRVRNYSHVQLQIRDKQVIEYLLKYRVATIYQLLKHLTIGSYRNHFCQRLNKLVKFGFLISHWYERKKVYSLGEKGQTYLIKELLIPKRFQVQHIGNVLSKTHHDVMLNDVYHVVEGFDFVQQVRTHNQLLIGEESYSRYEKISDGIIILHSPEGKEVPVALEVELSPKKKSLYHHVFYGYLSSQNISLVIYLVHNNAMKRMLLEIGEDFFKWDKCKLYVGLVDDFLANPLTCELISPYKKKLTFSMLSTSEPVQRFRTDSPTIGTKELFDDMLMA